MKRRVPRLATDEEAEAFLDSDLSDLDFSQFRSGRLRLNDRSGTGTAPIGIEPSETYRLFEQAMVQERPIVCVYLGERREVCPIILGYKEGEEAALTYQVAGGSTSTKKLPAEGGWKCLELSKVSEAQLRNGPWISGTSHKRPASCVKDVDLDVNPDSPYNPRRSLQQLRAQRAASIG